MEKVEKLIKKTMLSIEPIEKKRDERQAKERLRTTAKALLKHTNNVPVDGGYWGWVPKSIFNIGLSSRAIGLLVTLAMNANTLPYTKGRRIVARVQPITIMRWLDVANRNQIKTIRELLDELEKAEVIKINSSDIELLFPSIDELGEQGGFCKIYTNTYKRIIEQSNSIVALNRLAVYVAMRSVIYEGRKGSSTYNVVYHQRSNSYLAEQIGTTEYTVRNTITWFIDNEILAWNLVQNRNKYNNKVYYLSEYHNTKSLIEEICDDLMGGRALRVVA